MSEFELAGEFSELVLGKEGCDRLLAQAVASLKRIGRRDEGADALFVPGKSPIRNSRLTEGLAEAPKIFANSEQVEFPSFSLEPDSVLQVRNVSVPRDSQAAEAWRRAKLAGVAIEACLDARSLGAYFQSGTSGFLLSENIVATVDHGVYSRGILPPLAIYLADGTETTGRMVARDEAADIALVRLHAPASSNLEALTLASDPISDSISDSISDPISGPTKHSFLFSSLIEEDMPVGIYGHPKHSVGMVASLGNVKMHLDEYYPEGLAPFDENLMKHLRAREAIASKVHCTASVTGGYSGSPLVRWSDTKVIGIDTHATNSFYDHKLGANIWTSFSASAANVNVIQSTLEAVEREIG